MAKNQLIQKKLFDINFGYPNSGQNNKIMYKRMFGHQKLCKIDSNIDNENSYKYFIAKHLSSRPNRAQLVDIFSKGAFLFSKIYIFTKSSVFIRIETILEF